MAIVEGRLQIREWTDKSGNKRRTAEVVADNVYFGDSKKENKEAPEYKQADFAEISEEDGELPF